MVYVIKGTDGDKTVFKIGTTGQDVWERLRQIQGNIPTPLSLVAVMIGDRSDEQMFHNTFSKYRLRGEWFSDCRGLRALIDDFPVSVWEKDIRMLKFGEMDFEEFYIKHTLLRFEAPIIAINTARQNIKEGEERLKRKANAKLS